MAETERSWSVKLAITVVVGGAISLWMFWQFSSTFNVPDGFLDIPFGFRHVATVIVCTAIAAATVCFSRRHGWYKSVMEASVLMTAASLVITVAFVAFMVLGTIVVNGMLH